MNNAQIFEYNSPTPNGQLTNYSLQIGDTEKCSYSQLANQLYSQLAIFKYNDKVHKLATKPSVFQCPILQAPYSYTCTKNYANKILHRQHA